MRPDVAAASVARLRPTSLACVTSPTGAEPWRDIPSTYLLCTRDKAIAPELQAIMSRRAGNVLELDTDHSPFYSAPEALVRLLTSPAIVSRS